MFDDKEFDKLKTETFDILCGVGGLWQPFEEIAAIHLECDGNLDEDKLRIALKQLVAEGKIECLKCQGDEEYRWIDVKTRSKPLDAMELVQKERKYLLDMINSELTNPVAIRLLKDELGYRIRFKIPPGEEAL